MMLVGSILHGGPIEVFIVLASGIFYPICGMIKEPLLLIEVAQVVAADLLSCYLSGPLPYVRRHVVLTVNKMCRV